MEIFKKNFKFLKKIMQICFLNSAPAATIIFFSNEMRTSKSLVWYRFISAIKSRYSKNIKTLPFSIL